MVNQDACPKCKKPLRHNVRFCTACGTFIDRKPEGEDKPLHVQVVEALGDEYEMIGELGRGGFAIVYSVRDKKSQRYLAVKVIRPEYATSDTIIERFRREASYVMRLDHPNILSISFAAERGDLVYYAMPRLEGHPLNKLIEQKGAFELKEAAHIMLGVAEGLNHAHSKGIVHRDIKPSNLFVTREQVAKILDFGIARALSPEGTTISASGEIIGTLEYMSPEQADGSRHITHKSDIYSWGVVGFELLVGHPPFTGDVKNVMYDQIWTDAPDILGLRPDLPAPLGRLVNKCLEKDPAKRAFNMGQVVAELDDLVYRL